MVYRYFLVVSLFVCACFPGHADAETITRVACKVQVETSEWGSRPNVANGEVVITITESSGDLKSINGKGVISIVVPMEQTAYELNEYGGFVFIPNVKSDQTLWSWVESHRAAEASWNEVRLTINRVTGTLSFTHVENSFVPPQERKPYDAVERLTTATGDCVKMDAKSRKF